MNNPSKIVELSQGETSGGKTSVLPRGIVRTSTTKQIVLNPSGFLSIPVNGTKFYIVDCDSSSFIGIKTDKTVEELYTAGTGKAFTDEQYFTSLEIRNVSATQTITLLLFAGFGDYIDRRLTVVDGRFNSIVPFRDSPSEFVSYPGSVLAATTGVVFTGIPANSNRVIRKCIQVTNGDATLRLYLRDSLGNVGLEIFPETSITLPIAGYVELYNPQPAPMSYRFSEIWWTKTTV